jgi:hypothetical protein
MSRKFPGASLLCERAVQIFAANMKDQAAIACAKMLENLGACVGAPRAGPKPGSVPQRGFAGSHSAGTAAGKAPAIENDVRGL